MNMFLLAMTAIIVGDAILQWVVHALTLRRLSPVLDPEFAGWYDDAKYRKSQEYTRATTRFEQVKLALTTPCVIAFLVVGGFGRVNDFAVNIFPDLVGAGLVFSGILLVLTQLIGLPFDIYDTFVIEERFGFNRTSARTFIADRIKSLLLTMLLGGILFAGILWFFAEAGTWGWAIAWGAVTLFQFIMMLIAPSLLLPLFNKFTPLQDSPLKEAIERYASSQSYRLSGIFTIDGSRRSSKANAYVTGLGRLKRIALFDTLIEQHTTDELVGVLAHEVGHAKLGHIRKMLVTSIFVTGIMFYLLSLFISEPGLYKALRVSIPADGPLPLYAGMIAFSILFSPISRILSVYGNFRSRQHEYEADAFAVSTTGGNPETMITALKKLSVENLSNLTPHPFAVWLEYSHPPVLQRIAALRRANRPPA